MKEHRLTEEYLGYVSGPEISSLDPRYLVKGSKNVLIDNGRRSYTSRPGIELLGDPSFVDEENPTEVAGVRGRFHWKTSTKLYHLLRSTGRYLQVLVVNPYGGGVEVWENLLTNLSSAECEFATIFDSTEKQDICCFVNGDSTVKNWSGGVAFTRAQTAGGTTLKLAGSYTASTIAFVDGGASMDTITDSANGFVDAGFLAGDVIQVSGTTNNNRRFTIGTVAAGVITLIPDDSVTAEGAGASVTIHSGHPTWKSRGFLASGTRKVLIDGTEYEYTGGEGTDTLTGLTALPETQLGTSVLQVIRSNTNASPFPSGYSNDFIGSQRNQIWIGSKTSRLVFASKTSSYTDFTYTANRVPGEGVELNLDTFCQGFEATKDEITVFGGQDDIYKVRYAMSSDNTKEAVSIDKLDTAPGQGLVSPRAKTRVKNGIAIITSEPTLDTIEAIESKDTEQKVPVSDLVKDDFDSYDFTGAEMMYWKRNIVISVPAESVVLFYDLRYGMWHPPQEFAASIGGLAIGESGELIGHSYTTAESYVLFSPNVLADEVGDEIEDDQFEGFAIEAVARHYANDGKPDQQKRFQDYHVAGYVSAGASVEHRVFYEIDGEGGSATKTISALDDRFLFGQSDIHWLGRNPLGYAPLGGGGIDGTAGLFRFRKNHTFRALPYYEMFTEFYQNSTSEQFTICVHGTDATETGEEDTHISD